MESTSLHCLVVAISMREELTEDNPEIKKNLEILRIFIHSSAYAITWLQ